MCGVILLVAVQQAKPQSNVPVFQVEALWPKLPDKLKEWGPLFGIAVDSHDHVWILQRPSRAKDVAQAGPPVLEFDAAGNYIQGWGGPGQGYEWPEMGEHGIFVDHKDNVWIAGSGRTDTQVLKFTKTGKFLLQIGHRGKSDGSNDTTNLAGASDVFVYPKTNEVFVADGYRNKRVIVFDADTGAFKRYWGAYGNKPVDITDRKDHQQWATVHDVLVSNDGHVYVSVMQQGRIQDFTLDGKFVKELVIDRDTNNLASIAFSPDAKQQFLYVADYRKLLVHILDRQTLQTVGLIGEAGEFKGSPEGIYGPHFIAADSKGNIYAAELGTQVGDFLRGRAQKFLFKK
jgi:DNA-binding beta-propeller fold protein YncE